MNGYFVPVHTAVVGVLLDRSSQMLPQKEGLVGIVQNLLTKIKDMTPEPPKIAIATSLSETSDLVILADGECTETVQFEVELFEFHGVRCASSALPTPTETGDVVH